MYYQEEIRQPYFHFKCNEGVFGKLYTSLDIKQRKPIWNQETLQVHGPIPVHKQINVWKGRNGFIDLLLRHEQRWLADRIIRQLPEAYITYNAHRASFNNYTNTCNGYTVTIQPQITLLCLLSSNRLCSIGPHESQCNCKRQRHPHKNKSSNPFYQNQFKFCNNSI